VPTLLVVDDNAKVSESIGRVLGPFGYACCYAADTKGALQVLGSGDVDAVLLDIMLGKESGVDCLRLIKEEDPSMPVIMITGFATIDNAVKSMKLGAYDFIQKPLDVEHLHKILENAVKMKRLVGENSALRDRIAELKPKPAMESPRMHALFMQAARVARTDLPVLIRGENGTGKELLADYIHSESGRAGSPLLKINCAAFPESLLDNELFGHERGAYTGATASFRGIFERASGGTLFLDEVGDMPPAIQAKILRVLQNSELRRIGGSDTVKIDVRFIAATNKDLEALMHRGEFREDLFFRLNAVTLAVPPLRDRAEDIPVLAEHFVEDFNGSTQCVAKRISPEAMGILAAYSWPGNVRELKNTVMYACAMAPGETILETDLPPLVLSSGQGRMPPQSLPEPSARDLDSKYGLDPRSKAEAEIIASVLRQCGYNKKRAAEQLNMSRNTLYKKIASYNIETGTGR